MSIAAAGSRFDARLPVLSPDQPRAEMPKAPVAGPEPHDVVQVRTAQAGGAGAVAKRSIWSKGLLTAMTGLTAFAGLGATAAPALAHTAAPHAAMAAPARGNTGFQARGNTGFQARGNTGFQARGNSGFQQRGNTGFQQRGGFQGNVQQRGNFGTQQGHSFQPNTFRGNAGTFRGGVPGGRVPGGIPGGRLPGGIPGGRLPGGIPGGRLPGGIPGGRLPGGIPGGRLPGGIPGGRLPGGIPGGRLPGGFPGGRLPGGGFPGWRSPGGGWHAGPVIAPRPEFRDRVIFNNYFGPHWGPRWGGPWGFWGGGNFWLGFSVGALVDYDLWATQPIYVVSPYSGCAIGTLEQPVANSPLSPERQMQLSVLNSMADPQQAPDSYDPTAGVYPAYGDNIDQNNPGPKVTGAYAYNLLSEGRGIFFKAPNGAYEKIQNLDELNSYLYAPQSAAPAGASVIGQPQ